MVFGSLAQYNLLRNVWSSVFKLIWQVGISCLLEGDAPNHVTAALERIHFLQYLGLAINYAAARRGKHLVPGKRKEVAIKLLNIYQHMRRALGAIDENRNAILVRLIDHFLDRVNRTERI